MTSDLLMKLSEFHYQQVTVNYNIKIDRLSWLESWTQISKACAGVHMQVTLLKLIQDQQLHQHQPRHQNLTLQHFHLWQTPPL